MPVAGGTEMVRPCLALPAGLRCSRALSPGHLWLAVLCPLAGQPPWCGSSLAPSTVPVWWLCTGNALGHEPSPCKGDTGREQRDNLWDISKPALAHSAPGHRSAGMCPSAPSVPATLDIAEGLYCKKPSCLGPVCPRAPHSQDCRTALCSISCTLMREIAEEFEPLLFKMHLRDSGQ